MTCGLCGFHNSHQCQNTSNYASEKNVPSDNKLLHSILTLEKFLCIGLVAIDESISDTGNSINTTSLYCTILFPPVCMFMFLANLEK